MVTPSRLSTPPLPIARASGAPPFMSDFSQEYLSATTWCYDFSLGILKSSPSVPVFASLLPLPVSVNDYIFMTGASARVSRQCCAPVSKGYH